MQSDSIRKGTFFALAAAAINGSIGVFSKTLFSVGMAPEWVAFLKTLLGLVILSAWLWAGREKSVIQPGQRLWVGLAAFFGIFMLFFFETNAYTVMPAANVVVILMATSVITANVASSWLLKTQLGINQWLGAACSIGGIAFLAGFDGRVTATGCAFSLLAGLGYGVFGVILKMHAIQGGLYLTRQLLFWGCIFLLAPATQQGLDAGQLFSPVVAVSLVCLATLPSILGFFCTTKAINYLPPERVQLLELSEPLFSAVLALVFLHEPLTAVAVGGGLLCATGIFIGNLPARMEPEAAAQR